MHREVWWVGIRSQRRSADGSGQPGVGRDAARGRPGCPSLKGRQGCWLKESGGVRPRPGALPSVTALGRRARGDLPGGLANGVALAAIAAPLGRSVSTASREVRRNTTPVGYRAHRAGRMAQARTRRRRPGKLATTRPPSERVEEGLREGWSPQQISAPPAGLPR